METETLAVTPAKAEGRKRRARAGKPDRGIFEKVPGSGVWWIRYVDAQRRYRREKTGTWSNADKLLVKRQIEGVQGKSYLRHCDSESCSSTSLGMMRWHIRGGTSVAAAMTNRE